MVLLVSGFPLFAFGSGEIASHAGGAAGNGQATEARNDAAPANAGSEIPVTRVVLFSSGVGFFQRSGVVDGNQEIVLTVSKDAVNDLLKSLTVRDEGGHVGTVNYPSQDPLGRALASFSIDLADNPSIAQILSRGRGARVTVKVLSGKHDPVRASGSVAGTVLGIESRPSVTGARSVGPSTGAAEELYLDLLTSSGIRSFRIASLDQIQFEDPRIGGDLARALSLVAANRNADTKQLTLAFKGQGKRPISLSYLLETPVWKTSYRLAVDSSSAPAAQAFLQGWAIIDNPTNEDWRNVKLDLVSGMPISFKMDLGAPVYNQRPTVEVPLPPSVTPRTYESSMEPSAAATSEAPAPAAAGAMEKSLANAAPRAAAPRRREERPNGQAARDGGFSLDAGMEAAAVGAAAGEFFQYSIKDPVTLPREQSAMVPIINQAIRATRVSIYDESVLERHPLSGLRIKNTTGLHLAAGPITVFEDGTYSGDAEIGDLAPNEERLVSFAVDLDTDVAVSSSSAPDLVTSIAINRGSLSTTTKLEREHDFTFVNRGKTAREILTEYPISSDWTLTAPTGPVEKTANRYRFAVRTDPASGGKTTLAVKEERLVRQSILVANLDSRAILFYLGQRAASPKLKAALTRLSELKASLDDLVAQRKTLQDRADAISKDQGRIRANMEVLDRTSDLYRRYVAVLGSEEDELAAGRTQIDNLSQRIEGAQRQIDAFVATLSVS